MGDPIPVWFNEGLATYISGDERFPAEVSDADIAWIKDARTRKDWNRLLAARGWWAGYGAAKAAVAALDAEIGRSGLRRIIERVAAGEEFDYALVAKRTRVPPD